jgi:23S rRNA pseudouridine2605 synthase
MATAGVASRRASERLISDGRVAVNGEIVTELGTRIDPHTDTVAVDGSVVQLDPTRRYIVLNKPVGVVSTMNDDRGRPDLAQFVSRQDERLFNVGRLDAATSGLLLLTNDGELAHVLAHPSFGVAKTYVAKVEGRVGPATLALLKRGIDLDDGRIVADQARLIAIEGRYSLLEITLHSGRKRIVRRMLDAVGHPVVELVRRQFGPLQLGDLRMGRTRSVTRLELSQLLTLARSRRNSTGDVRTPTAPTGKDS